MVGLARGIIRCGKLAYLYVSRILFTTSHLKVSLLKRLYFNIAGGFTGDQVALYGLTRKNKKLYLSEFDWYRSRYINGPFSAMLNNKIVCDKILSQHAHVPQTFLIKERGGWSSYDPSIRTARDLVERLHQEKKMILKPLAAGRGRGIGFLRCDSGNLYVGNKQVSAKDMMRFLESNNDYYVSEFVEQSDFLNGIYDRTSNTLRFVTLKDPETGQFKIFFAVLRIGTKETIPVDNGSRGGLISKVDIGTGELSEAKSLRSRNAHEFHPDSQNPIKGLMIPDWTRVCQEILDLCDYFPFLHIIAWDVLLTNDGVCIVEANTSTGNNIIQIWGGQRLGELGDFYRHHGVIRK
ncbi:MAG: hypothetical protein FWG15_08315 [Propionibacteriaceae bacterium]|nr:hypothetical protein [Propionibacteriaceae bacterium]